MCVFASALERKLNEAETEKFNIKQMKDLFEQKAAQLATEIVGVCDGELWCTLLQNCSQFQSIYHVNAELFFQMSFKWDSFLLL